MAEANTPTLCRGTSMSASPLKILQEGQAADHTGFLMKTGGESK